MRPVIRTAYAVLFFFLLSARTNYVFSQSVNLYSFGPNNGDLQLLPKVDDGFSSPIPLSLNFPYFNKSFTSLFVCTNGLITFERGVSRYTPQPFPVQDVIGVAPFWTDVDIRVGGDIYYREVTSSSDLQAIAADIKIAFAQFVNFRPTWAFIATWFEVSRYGSNPAEPRNTFQAVIATNGRHSFAVFNYAKIDWISSGGAQAGFNSGLNNQYFVVPGSRTPAIMNLTQTSNIGVPGKWIFRIDNSDINEGGCNTEGFFTVSPKSVTFLGGEELLITGPCFNATDPIQLRVDETETVTCEITANNEAICLTPFLHKLGKINLRIENTEKSLFTGFVESKKEDISTMISGLQPIYEEENPTGTVELKWEYYSEITTPLSLSIMEFRDTGIQTRLVKSDIQSNQVDVTESELFPDEDKFENENGLTLYYVILKQGTRIIKFHPIVRTIRTAVKVYRKLSKYCDKWYKSQPDPRSVMDQLPPCPLTTPATGGEFLKDFQGFEMDAACNPSTLGSFGCMIFHPGSEVCYRSTASTQVGKYNAGQQCCYTKDNRLNVDPDGCGTIDFAHSSDVMKHFREDVLPYFACRVTFQKDKYSEKRPCDDGSRWVPPRNGGGRGDPHFVTLDGVDYTFNGFGEFVFLRLLDSSFEVQVRLTPVNSGGTVITGVAIGGSSGVDKLQVEIDRVYGVGFFVNGVAYDGLSENSTIHLERVKVMKQPNVFTLIYNNGIELEVTVNLQHKALTIMTSVAQKYLGKTRGLLGTMDNNSNNEFTLLSGEVLTLDPTDDRRIFFDFGKFLQVNQTNSLFTYYEGRSSQDYTNETFVPPFATDGVHFSSPQLQAAAILQCGNNTRCLYDVSATGDVSFGQLTLTFESSLEESKHMLSNMSSTCGYISPTQFPFGNLTLLEDGRQSLKYQCKCMDGFSLIGMTEISCIGGVWLNEIPTCKKSSSSYLILLISLPLCLGFILILLGSIMVCTRRRQQTVKPIDRSEAEAHNVVVYRAEYKANNVTVPGRQGVQTNGTSA